MKCVTVKGLLLSMVSLKHVHQEDIQVNLHHVLPHVNYALQGSFPLLDRQSVADVYLEKYRIQQHRVLNVQLGNMQSLVIFHVRIVL